MAGQDAGGFEIDFHREGVFAAVFLDNCWGRDSGIAADEIDPRPRWASTRPTPSETVAAGRSIYATTYSRCHGAEGSGGGSGGTVPTIRHYEGGQEKFLRTVENGKSGTPMAPFKGILTREEILEVYQYLTSRPRRPG